MADLNMDFNPNEVPEDDRSFDPIPAGDYQMQVIDSAVKETKTGSGEYLELTLEVMTGPSANRRLWDRLNIRNQNPDAQRIAQRALADLCLATGLQTLRNSEDLHFRPFTARVTVAANKQTGQQENRIRYKAPNARPAGTVQQPAQRPAQQPQQAAAASQQRPAAGAAKPWLNRPASAAPQRPQTARQMMDDDIPF